MNLGLPEQQYTSAQGRSSRTTKVSSLPQFAQSILLLSQILVLYCQPHHFHGAGQTSHTMEKLSC